MTAGTDPSTWLGVNPTLTLPLKERVRRIRAETSSAPTQLVPQWRRPPGYPFGLFQILQTADSGSDRGRTGSEHPIDKIDDIGE